MSDLKRARDSIALAIKLVDSEMSKPDPIVPQGDLAYARSVLADYLDQLNANALPSKDARPSLLGRMVTDSWPLRSKLSEAIIKAEHIYRAL
jgi:hypothetical protein